MPATTLLFLAAGASIAVIAWVAFKDAPRVVRSLRQGRRVRGQIVRDETFPFSYGRLHFPVFIFRDESGMMHEVQSRYEKKTSAREQMGDVDIAYLPHDPKRTAVLVGARYYLSTLVSATIFLALAAGIPAMLWWSQK